MEVVANEWFERRSRNQNNDIDAMIHTLDCHLAIRFGNGPKWHRFESIEAAFAHYGEFAFVAQCCLADQGPHLDRS